MMDYTGMAMGQMAQGGYGSGYGGTYNSFGTYGYPMPYTGPTQYTGPQGFQMSGDPNAGATNFSNYQTTQNYNTNTNVSSDNRSTNVFSNPLTYTGGSAVYNVGTAQPPQQPGRPAQPAPPPQAPQPPTGPTSNMTNAQGQPVDIYGNVQGRTATGGYQNLLYQTQQQYQGGGQIGGFNGGPAIPGGHGGSVTPGGIQSYANRLTGRL